MNAKTPTLDQVEELVGNYPGFFSSPLQTQRSIVAARGQGPLVQSITAQNHYADYLKGGGAPIGSGGSPGAARSLTDPGFGKASCNCESAKPCCIFELKVGCTHNKNRVTFPQHLVTKQAAKPRQVVFVADGGGGSGKDTVTFTPLLKPPAKCGKREKAPELHIAPKAGRRSAHPYIRKLSGPTTWDAEYTDSARLGGGDFMRFLNATWKTIFGRVEDMRQEYGVAVKSCAGRSDMDFTAHVYPKVQWKSSEMNASLNGTFYTNGSFQFSAALSGKVEGVYGPSSFSLSANPSSKGELERNVTSMIPFIDGALKRMRAATRQGTSVGGDKPTTYSSIKVRHGFSLGKSTFKLAENPSDYTEVGVDAEIYLGYDPFFGITATLDMIDALLTAANASAPGLANAIRKGREAAAKGVGDKNGPLHLAAHAAITLAVSGDLGKGGVTLIRKPGQKTWTGRGEVEGSTGLELAGVIKADGKAYIVQGTFSAEAKARSKLTAGLQTLPPASQTGGKGGKAKVKVEWDGIKISYSAQVQATVVGISTGRKQESGEVVVCQKEVLYEKTI